MQQAIIIRVTADDYDTWLGAHSSQEEARKHYGMTDGPFYRRYLQKVCQKVCKQSGGVPSL